MQSDCLFIGFFYNYCYAREIAKFVITDSVEDISMILSIEVFSMF